MADVEKTVEIVFGSKNELSGTVNDISNVFDDFDASVSKITEPLSKMFDSVVKVDAALAALAIGGMALAIKESATFNNSFALISTSITATGDDLIKYRDDVLEYSVNSVKSLDDINASLYTAAQAGVKYTESIAFIGKAEELAVANKANLNTTVDLLTGTMNAYGFTVKDLGHLNDVFFTSTLIGKQTIDELGISMGQVVGIAANAGVSFEELNAAIATLTAKGMTTETAITAVKGVITTLISPSKEAAEAAKALGLNFSLTELTSKGFAGILTEIMEKTGGSKEKMVELFSELRAMNGVLSLTGDGMEFFNESLQRVINSAGESEKAYAKMVGTFTNQSQMVINVAKGMMISVGTELEPIAAKIGGGLAGLFAGVKIGVDNGAFDPLFTALEAAGADLAKWLTDIGKVMPEALEMLDFDKLIEAFGALGDAVGAYFGGLDLTKADDLASAMQTIIDIVTGLVNVTSGMAEAFQPFVIQIVEFLKTMAAGGPEAQELIGEILAFSKAIQGAGLMVVAAIITIDELGISMKGLFNTVSGSTTVLFNFLQLGVDGILLMFEGVAFALLKILDTVTLGMIPGITEAKENIGATIKGLAGDVRRNVDEATGGFKQLGEGLGQLAFETGNTSDKAKTLYDRFKAVPTTVETTVKINDYELSESKINKFYDDVVKIPDTKDVSLGVNADTLSLGSYADGITKVTNNGETVWTYIGTKTDAKALDKTKADVTAFMKEQSDIIQKSIEWKAKVDISEAEEATKRLTVSLDSINKGFESTGGQLTNLFGLMKGESFFSLEGSAIQDQIKRENDLRQGEFELQKELIESQIKLQDSKTKAIESGTQLIQVEAAGLQPHLEMILWEILSAIQIRANEEGSEFLLGMTA